MLGQQGMHAVDMVGMVVRDEDGGKRQSIAFECMDGNGGVARVYNDGMLSFAQQPDVVILERR